MNHAHSLAALTAQSLADHHARMRWEDGEPGYMLGMMLTDLMAFATVHGLNFEEELTSARETFADAYLIDLTPCATATMPAPTDLPAAAAEMSELMLDALGVHIYSLEDGDVIPADCHFAASIQRVRAALGLEPADIVQAAG